MISLKNMCPVVEGYDEDRAKKELKDIVEFLKDIGYKESELRQLNSILVASEKGNPLAPEYKKLSALLLTPIMTHLLFLKEVKTLGQKLDEANIYCLKPQDNASKEVDSISQDSENNAKSILDFINTTRNSLFTCSASEFSNFLYTQCQEVEDSNDDEKSFLFCLEDHAMVLKIKKSPGGIKIQFYDPNNSNIFAKKYISSSIQAKKLKLSDFLSTSLNIQNFCWNSLYEEKDPVRLIFVETAT